MFVHNCAMYSVKHEDRCFLRRFSDGSCVCGVVDGHGGNAAAQLCREYLVGLSALPQNMDRIFMDLHASCSALPCNSGASLTVCILEGDRLICANVGDSHALVVTPTSHYWMTESHRLQDNVAERTKLGPHVSHVAGEDGRPIGPPRLFPGGLSCSRSIGDGDCPYTSCIPSVCETVLRADDILVVASDGVWDRVRLSSLCRKAREYHSALMLLQGVQFDDDASVLLLSCSQERTSVFRRVGSNSSISSDEDTVPPPRRVVKIQL